MKWSIAFITLFILLNCKSGKDRINNDRLVTLTQIIGKYYQIYHTYPGSFTELQDKIKLAGLTKDFSFLKTYDFRGFSFLRTKASFNILVNGDNVVTWDVLENCFISLDDLGQRPSNSFFKSINNRFVFVGDSLNNVLDQELKQILSDFYKKNLVRKSLTLSEIDSVRNFPLFTLVKFENMELEENCSDEINFSKDKLFENKGLKFSLEKQLDSIKEIYQFDRILFSLKLNNYILK